MMHSCASAAKLRSGRPILPIGMKAKGHGKMVAIPSIMDEDAKRPNRERESLIGEQSRIVNRMKAALIRLGIRGFNPKLKRAAGRLEDLRTPEGEPIPPNTLAELRRDMARRRLIS